MRITMAFSFCFTVTLAIAQNSEHVGIPIPNEPHVFFLVDSSLTSSVHLFLEKENALEKSFSYSIYQSNISLIALRDSIAIFSQLNKLTDQNTHFIHVSQTPQKQLFSNGYFASQSNWITREEVFIRPTHSSPINLKEEIHKWYKSISPCLIHMNAPHYLTPHIFIQTSMADYKAMRTELERIAVEEQLCSFTIIPNSFSTQNTCDSINAMLNGPSHISKQHVHFMAVGSGLFTSPFSDGFFATSLNTTYVRRSSSFMLEGKTTTIEELLKIWNSSYTWTYSLHQIKQYHFKDVTSSKSDKFVKFSFGVTNFVGKKDTNSVDNNFMSYQLTTNFQVVKKLRFSPFLNLSFNTPNPQQAIQNEVSNQIDIQSIIDGTNTEDEQEIELDLNFNGHVYINAGFTTDYTFTTNSFLKPYVGAGISIVSYNALQIEIDTTLTIDLTEFTPGSGDGFGDFDEADRDQSAAGEGLTSYGGLSTTFLVGAEAKIGKRWNAYIEGRYQPTISYLSGNANYGQSFALQLGLAFRLNKRDHRVYEYARIR